MDPPRGRPPLLQGLRILAEKVVHHPTIIAGHAEGRRWTLDADSDLRSKFWGRSIELMPVGAPLASDTVQYCPGSPTPQQVYTGVHSSGRSFLQAPFAS